MSKQSELVGLARTTNLDEVNAAYSAGALSNRNLIINGDFQVSQRGDYTSAVSPTNGTYYLDRWLAVINTVTGTLQDINRKVKLVATSTATGSLRIVQRVELQTMNKFNNQTVTLSAKVKSNSAQARMGFYADGYLIPTGSATHTGDGTEQTLTAQITVPASTLTVEFDVFIGLQGASAGDNVSITSGDYVEITEVQLEVGDTATPFEHRSYGQELALCQRYYETGDAMISGVKSQTPTGCLEYESFKVSKRSPPTMTKLNMGSLLSVTDVLFFGVNYSPLEAFGHTTSTGASGQHIRYSIKWAADAEL